MPHPDQLDSPEGRRLLAALRETCGRLPGVEEVRDGWGHTTFKVGGKSFALAGADGGVPTLTFKADLPSQALLVRRGPFYPNRFIGHHGWTTLPDPLAHPWAEVEALLEDAWRLQAPKRLVRRLEEEG